MPELFDPLKPRKPKAETATETANPAVERLTSRQNPNLRLVMIGEHTKDIPALADPANRVVIPAPLK